jgi:hypothetical protein
MRGRVDWTPTGVRASSYADDDPDFVITTFPDD